MSDRSRFVLIERQGYKDCEVADADSLEDILDKIEAKTGAARSVSD